MSSRFKEVDERREAPINSATGTSPGLYGRRVWVVSNGVNQFDWDNPWEEHPYSANIGDEFTMLFKQCRGIPANTDTWAITLPTGQPIRPWSVSDDYALYGKLEKEYDKGDFNAGVFVGELGESVELLASRASQLFRAARAAKRGNLADAAKILRAQPPSGARRAHREKPGLKRDQTIASGWLELQYGWLPLMGDIYSLSDQIAKMDKPRKRRIFARQWIGHKADPNPHFEISGAGKTGKQIIAFVTEDIPSWPQALGLTDPELVAWELVPFSFVADWFIPIGNYLQARAFASRAKGLFVLTTYEKSHWRCAAAKPITFWDGTSCVSLPTTLGWNRKVVMDRTVASSLPQVPLPTFSNGIGRGWRLQNAVALAASIFGGQTSRR